MRERSKRKETHQVDNKKKGGAYCDDCGAGPQKVLHYTGSYSSDIIWVCEECRILWYPGFLLLKESIINILKERGYGQRKVNIKPLT